MGNKAEEPRNLANDEHDEAALREAERRMLLHDGDESDDEKAGKDADSKAGTPAETGGQHDVEADEEASERMLLRRDLR